MRKNLGDLCQARVGLLTTSALTVSLRRCRSCRYSEERHCQLYVQLLQRLRWKKFVVRGEEQVRGREGQNVDDMRKLPSGFCEFGQEEAHLFAKTLKDAGLEDLFRTSMK